MGGRISKRLPTSEDLFPRMVFRSEQSTPPTSTPLPRRASESCGSILLKQVRGVGDLIATTYVLTLEDTHRFRKSRDAGCFVGLQPGRRNSGESEPQMRISKEQAGGTAASAVGEWRGVRAVAQ